MVFFISLHIFLMGLISGVHGCQSVCSTSACHEAILEPHKTGGWRSGLAETGLIDQDKALLQMCIMYIKMCLY